jgi:hypothetical protein
VAMVVMIVVVMVLAHVDRPARISAWGSMLTGGRQQRQPLDPASAGKYQPQAKSNCSREVRLVLTM